eukprot:TRINITY_DN15212_c0_g1_i8.p2 TRINITY_DN15212_c0_g1~~TRINITY_DN15212_c0_g1_i8.p2  ORF type:complete len:106 (-),score=10.74 TRINITY_DN15212_c0_g1_i8:72-389(-)
MAYRSIMLANNSKRQGTAITLQKLSSRHDLGVVHVLHKLEHIAHGPGVNFSSFLGWLKVGIVGLRFQQGGKSTNPHDLEVDLIFLPRQIRSCPCLLYTSPSPRDS